jgi:hypothetical protein
LADCCRSLVTPLAMKQFATVDIVAQLLRGGYSIAGLAICPDGCVRFRPVRLGGWHAKVDERYPIAAILIF